MPKRTPESAVDAFLKNVSDKQIKCPICKAKNASEIDRAIRHFKQKRDRGDTTHPWSAFHKHVLIPEFQLSVSAESLRRHVRNCLGKV